MTCPHGKPDPCRVDGQIQVCFQCAEPYIDKPIVSARAQKDGQTDIVITKVENDQLKIWGEPLNQKGWEIKVSTNGFLPPDHWDPTIAPVPPQELSASELLEKKS